MSSFAGGTWANCCSETARWFSPAPLWLGGNELPGSGDFSRGPQEEGKSFDQRTCRGPPGFFMNEKCLPPKPGFVELGIWMFSLMQASLLPAWRVP